MAERGFKAWFVRGAVEIAVKSGMLGEDGCGCQNSASSGTWGKSPSPAHLEQPSTSSFKSCPFLKLTTLLPLAWCGCFSLITGLGNVWEQIFAQRACSNSSWFETNGQRWDLHFFLRVLLSVLIFFFCCALFSCIKKISSMVLDQIMPVPLLTRLTAASETCLSFRGV